MVGQEPGPGQVQIGAAGMNQERVVIIGDDPGAIIDARGAVEAFGAEVIASFPTIEGVDRLEAMAGGVLAMIEIDRDAGAAQDRLLDWLDAQAIASGIGSIISFPPECLDAVAARITAPPILLLCQPTIHDRIAALAVARRPGLSGFVAEAEAGSDALRLQRLADDLGRVARTLGELADVGRTRSVFAPAVPGTGPMPDMVSEPPSAGDVRRLIRLRRQRDRYFAGDLFADPAWDILLDLTASRLEGVRVAASSLCIAAAVPPTTALRWIRTMTDLGLLTRIEDPRDGRRVFIELAESSADGMMAFFGQVRRAGGTII